MLRNALERSVLAACLLESGYVRIAHILTEKNFSGQMPNAPDVTHSQIFHIISTLFPHNPVDIITVQSAHTNAYGYIESVAWYLADLTNRVSTVGNVVYYAMALLETDMREKFLLLLSTLRDENNQSGNPAAVGVLTEVILAVQMGHDLFSVIDNAQAYFERVGMEEEHARIVEFSSAVGQKATKIKQVHQIDRLIHELERLIGSDPAKMGIESGKNVRIGRLVQQLKDELLGKPIVHP